MAEIPEQEADPLARFRDWRGFLLAAIAVNALFAYGMTLGADHPQARIWNLVLVWLPFNFIATTVYYAMLVRLTGPERTPLARGFYRVLCGGLIVANWTLMLRAGA
ncbi:MAG: hypothetical protein HZB71_01685 [Betaproteobacteria bacterium]|nr:hypothetical protein [Betaproteobacteria bacterium]